MVALQKTVLCILMIAYPTQQQNSHFRFDNMCRLKDPSFETEISELKHIQKQMVRNLLKGNQRYLKIWNHQDDIANQVLKIIDKQASREKSGGSQYTFPKYSWSKSHNLQNLTPQEFEEYKKQEENDLENQKDELKMNELQRFARRLKNDAAEWKKDNDEFLTAIYNLVELTNVLKTSKLNNLIKP